MLGWLVRMIREIAGLYAKRVNSVLFLFVLLPFACLAQTPAASVHDKAVISAKEAHAKSDLDGVIRILSPLAERHPDRAEIQHLLGIAYYQRRDLADAIRHLSAALKLETENSAPWMQTVETLAMAYYFSNRLTDALPLLEKAAASNSGDTYFLYALAMAYAYSRDLNSARRTFGRLFDVPPDAPQAFLLTAHFLAREKLDIEAEKLILEAQKKRPDLPDINYRLGMIALTNGNLVEALKHLEKELAANPLHPMVWHYLGDIYIRQGKFDEATKSLQRAIWLNLRSTESYILIGKAYAHQSKYFEAEEALKRAVGLAPQSYEARFLLARVYQKTNRLELAKQEMAIANKLRAQSAAVQ